MENYEKYGSITISPTAITDKEETYDLHQRKEGGGVTSWNDLTDRPFWEEEEIILDYQILDFTNGNVFKFSNDKSITLGDILNVYWNDEMYTLIVNKRYGVIYVGNNTLFFGDDGDDTGEPFAYYCDNSGIYTLNSRCKSAVPVKITRKIVHKLDTAHMPCDAVIDVVGGSNFNTADSFTLTYGSYDVLRSKIMGGHLPEVLIRWEMVYAGITYYIVAKAESVAYRSNDAVIYIVMGSTYMSEQRMELHNNGTITGA